MNMNELIDNVSKSAIVFDNFGSNVNPKDAEIHKLQQKVKHLESQLEHLKFVARFESLS
jgi:hypothetical protein